MATSSMVTIKLYIDMASRKVLFAEAEKDFVDVLFNLLALPLGTATHLLAKDSMFGSINKLYNSIESCGESYLISPQVKKEALLQPNASSSRKLYACGSTHSHNYVADNPNMNCPNCYSKMARALTHVNSVTTKNSSAAGNSVKGGIKYMVKDDLTVQPISGIETFKSFKTINFGKLEEKEVKFDTAQGVKLLKASLESDNVLTSVFLGGSDAED